MLVRQLLDSGAQGVHLNVAAGRALSQGRADDVRNLGEVLGVETTRREGGSADAQARGDGRRTRGRRGRRLRLTVMPTSCRRSSACWPLSSDSTRSTRTRWTSVPPVTSLIPAFFASSAPRRSARICAPSRVRRWRSLNSSVCATFMAMAFAAIACMRGAALLAGCAAPAVPEAASAVQAVSSEAGTGHAGSRTEQLAVLDGLVDFGADTAGCAHLNWTPDGATTPELLLPAGVYDHPDILRHIVYPLLGERLRMPVFNGFIWRYLFSADILQRENVTFEGAYLEDELFLMEYFCHAQRLAVTEQPLYRYLINPNSATHKIHAGLCADLPAFYGAQVRPGGAFFFGGRLSPVAGELPLGRTSHRHRQRVRPGKRQTSSRPPAGD